MFGTPRMLLWAPWGLLVKTLVLLWADPDAHLGPFCRILSAPELQKYGFT